MKCGSSIAPLRGKGKRKKEKESTGKLDKEGEGRARKRERRSERKEGGGRGERVGQGFRGSAAAPQRPMASPLPDDLAVAPPSKLNPLSPSKLVLYSFL